MMTTPLPRLLLPQCRSLLTRIARTIACVALCAVSASAFASPALASSATNDSLSTAAAIAPSSPLPSTSASTATSTAADSAATAATAASSSRPKLFLNCAQSWFCYEDFVKTELSAFDFVRDRFLSSVEMLVIRQDGANGGSFFTVEFLGRRKGEREPSQHDTLTFSTNQSDTDDMIRQKLLKTLKLGLVRYALNTSAQDMLTVDFKKREQTELTKQKDPWDYWVFSLGLNGNIDAESNYSQIRLNGWGAITRTTSESRVTLNSWYGQNNNSFTVDGETINRSRKNYGAFGQYVYSLDEHWSVGATYMGEHSVFRNLEFAQRITPGVEYNFFPYSENTRRQLRVVYEVGYQHFRYMEETVFSRMAEGRAIHRLWLIADVNQSWGSINAALRGVNFLDNFSQHRFTLDARLNLRLVEGLSLNLFASASYIRDQISLAKASVDKASALLQNQQLPTAFSYSSWVGLTYTFGSIFNSVVNPRMGQVE
jgi:hypothetical protein